MKEKNTHKKATRGKNSSTHTQKKTKILNLDKGRGKEDQTKKINLHLVDQRNSFFFRSKKESCFLVQCRMFSSCLQKKVHNRVQKNDKNSNNNSRGIAQKRKTILFRTKSEGKSEREKNKNNRRFDCIFPLQHFRKYFLIFALVEKRKKKEER